MSEDALQARFWAALADRYVVERELGRGGMAAVYLARDRKHDRLVALKLLEPALGAALGAERFRREIALAASLQHPHVVPVFDSGDTPDGQLWYTMPFVAGESLRDRLQREGALPVPAVVTLAREVAAALDHAHRRGVVHRDVKPENVLLSEEGQALVADFGIARRAAQDEEHRLTATGLSLGTPSYMSPEQITGEGPLDGRADQYALACLVYEALAGRAPYEGPTAQAVIARHVSAPVPDLRLARPDVPSAVAAAVARAMAKAPEERFDSAGAFAAALDGGMSGGRGQAVPAPLRRGARRRTAVAGVAGLLVLVSAAGGWWLWRRDGAEPTRAPLDPERVVVTTFETRAGDAPLDALAREAAELVAQGIAQMPSVDVVPRADAVALERRVWTGDERSPAALGRAAGAGVVVSGHVGRLGRDSVVVRAALTDAATGRLLAQVAPVGAPLAAPGPPLEQVRERVRGGLAVLGDRSMGRGALVGREPPTYAAYREFALGQELASRGSEDAEAMIRHFERAAAMDTSFLLPRIAAVGHRALAWQSAGASAAQVDSLFDTLDGVRHRLTPHESVRLAYLRAVSRGDMNAAVDALRSVVAMDSTTLYGSMLAWRLLGINRPREALTILDAYWRRVPPRIQRAPRAVSYRAAMTTAHHLLGQHAAELAVARAGRRQRPSGLIELGYEAAALVGLDSLDVVQVRIDEALTLPPDPTDESEACDCQTAGDLMTAIAQELDAHGRPDEARALFERAVAWYRSSGATTDEVEQRVREAYALAALGRWEEVARLVDTLRRVPSDSFEVPGELPYLAGIASAGRGTRDAAEGAVAELARRARVERDQFLRGILLYRQAAVVARLGRREDAVSLLRQALPLLSEGAVWRFLHRDPDFAALRGHPPFEALLRPKG